MSIYKKIFLVAFIFILFGLSLSTLLNLRTTRSILHDEAAKRAMTLFRSLQEKCTYAVTVIDAESMETFVDRKSLTDFVHDIERNESDVEEVLILNGQGQVLSSMRQKAGPVDETVYAGVFDELPPGEILRRQDEDSLILLGGIHIDGMRWGTAVIEYSLASIQDETRLLTYWTLLMSAVFLLLGAVLSLPLVGTIVRPIKQLSEYAQAIGDGHLDQKIDVRSRDEIGQLAQTFSAMVAKLRTAMETLERRMDELRRSRERLRESEKSYRDLFENAVVGVFQATAEGAFIRVNPAMAAMLGYDSPEDLLASITDITRDLFVRREDRDELARVLRSEAKVADFETEAFRKDGSVVAVAVSARAVLDNQGIPQHVEGSLMDVTARKEKERAEREKEAAKASNEAKSAFLANMSHEIRTPMNAILGFSQLALRQEMEPGLRTYLRKIDAATHSLLGIVNDILDFSKIEAGKMQIERTGFSLNCVLESVLDTVGLRAFEKGLELLVDVAPDVPMQLQGDPTRLGQVLLNLGSNAVKFTHTGEIVFRVEVEEAAAGRATLLFSVSDTGIGLTPEQKSRLFKSFSQADDSTTRKYGGSGLGLAICKNLVELMQGRIGVESQAGLGSSFHFALPFGMDGEAECEGPLDERSFRALVLDDNATARRLLCRSLRELGGDAEGFADAALLEQHLQGLHPAGESEILLFIDMQMPGADGLEIAARLQAAAGESVLPCILLCSPYDLQGGRLPANTAQGTGGLVQGMLHKPVMPEKLCTFLRGFFAPDGESEAAGETCAASFGDLAGARVLLVEDNELNRQVALEFLQAEGVEAVVAENGRQALQRLEEGPFDLVLMDIQMPVMDGCEATRAIRKRPELAELPVLALTAHSLQHEREKCLDAGMNGHLDKPFHREDLLRAMRQWVRPRQTAAQPPRQDEPTQATDAAAPRKLPGLDCDAGLAYSNQNPELYQELLRQFGAQSRKLAAAMQQAMRDNDADAVSRAAHTLKSSARLVGAEGLCQAAAAMERGAAERDSWRSGYGRILEALQQVLDSLDALERMPASTDDAGQPAPDADAAMELVEELRQSLESDVKQALRHAESLEALLRHSQHAARALEIRNDVFEFEMQRAVQRLDFLARELASAHAEEDL